MYVMIVAIISLPVFNCFWLCLTFFVLYLDFFYFLGMSSDGGKLATLQEFSSTRGCEHHDERIRGRSFFECFGFWSVLGIQGSLHNTPEKGV